jgi:hypothetical protein
MLVKMHSDSGHADTRYREAKRLRMRGASAGSAMWTRSDFRISARAEGGRAGRSSRVGVHGHRNFLPECACQG